MRNIALSALKTKRGNTHGAALFSVLPGRRSRPLIRLLTTYQVLWDFLDSLTESDLGISGADVLHLHGALVDAIDPFAPLDDYYAPLGLPSDAGYLEALVSSCRVSFTALPSFGMVFPLLRREATRIGVQAINHHPDPVCREEELRAWVAREYPGDHEVRWFEIAAAAGANLAIYALFALAAEPHCCQAEITATYRAYFPWTGALATMLDGFVDQLDDARNSEQCYISYYGSLSHAIRQISRLTRRCLLETHALENGERHALVATAMVAMYLSRDSARSLPLRSGARQIVGAGGSLTRVLLPALRLWRVCNDSQAT